MTTPATEADLISALAGVAPDSALAELRAQRPEAMRHAQGSYLALFAGDAPSDLSRAERLAVAVHVARLHSDADAEAHYAGLLQKYEAPSGPRWAAIERHADLLALRPVEARPDDLQALADAGLGTTAIVTLSQVIAFVSFQTRVLLALRLLGGGPHAAGQPAAERLPELAPLGEAPANVIRPDSSLQRPTRFTIAQLGWTPWLEPIDLADASPEQAAALEGDRGKSPYFRLLARDVRVLVERTATDRGIFYTPGGAPRQDRELSAAATSRLNGCIYCTSVHARLAAQLSKRTDEVERMLARGVAPGTELGFDPRWQAVVDLAVALAPTPPAATTAHVERLRALGLAELEVLDVLQAAAFFAWANRLMLTLGEPHE